MGGREHPKQRQEHVGRSGGEGTWAFQEKEVSASSSESSGERRPYWVIKAPPESLSQVPSQTSWGGPHKALLARADLPRPSRGTSVTGIYFGLVIWAPLKNPYHSCPQPNPAFQPCKGRGPRHEGTESGTGIKGGSLGHAPPGRPLPALSRAPPLVS